MRPQEEREADSFSTFLNIAQRITQQEVGFRSGATEEEDLAISKKQLIVTIAEHEPVPVADLIRYTDLSFKEFSAEMNRLETAGAVVIERDESLRTEVVRLTDLGRHELNALAEDE